MWHCWRFARKVEAVPYRPCLSSRRRCFLRKLEASAYCSSPSWWRRYVLYHSHARGGDVLYEPKLVAPVLRSHSLGPKLVAPVSCLQAEHIGMFFEPELVMPAYRPHCLGSSPRRVPFTSSMCYRSNPSWWRRHAVCIVLSRNCVPAQGVCASTKPELIVLVHRLHGLYRTNPKLSSWRWHTICEIQV